MTSHEYSHCQPELLLDTVGGDQEVFLELAGIFMSESDTKFDKLRAAAAAADLQQMAYFSHSLKGIVGPLGALALMEMFFSIERECQSGACRCDDKRLSVIGDELDLVQREMRRFIERLPA